MIGTLRGTVEYREDTNIIVDVNGVGYRVLVPISVVSEISRLGEEIKLYTHTHVREDVLELYGFKTPEDLKIFEYLISVSGVGCRTAISVFSAGSRVDIISAITQNNTDFFQSVPRLGKKNAQKIIIELKNKLGGTEDLDLGQTTDEMKEVTAALKTFGFSTQEVNHALKMLKGEGETTSEKIRLALKYLGK